MIFKTGSIAEAKTVDLSNKKVASEVKDRFRDIPEDIVYDPNFVVSSVRGISARTNLNMDGFRKEELLGVVPSWLDNPSVRKHSSLEPHNTKFGYNTFKNKNNHVDHFNQPDIDHGDEDLNLKHTPRGTILHSSFHEQDWGVNELPVLGYYDTIEGRQPIYDPIAKLAGGDAWVELLIANDRRKFPILCRAIEDGVITKVSMGSAVLGSMCSICGNFAEFPAGYCNHIRTGRGAQHLVEPTSHLISLGAVEARQPMVAFEDNVGLEFFEESWILDVQADPTAIITELVKGEPGLPFSGLKAASANQDYDSMLIDILKLESSMGDDVKRKVANILKKSDEEPSNVNLNIDGVDFRNYDTHPADNTGKPMDYNQPPSQQPGLHYPDYPFPCSARVSASEANPQYPMDTSIDVEVCQGCMYNRTDKVGGVDCRFPEVVKKGGSDPLPPEFAAPEDSVESEEGSGFKTEDGHDVKLIPGTEHPPGQRLSYRNEAFYDFKERLNVTSGYWKTSEGSHTVEISVPSNQYYEDKSKKEPVENREGILDELTRLMQRTFGNVDTSPSTGTWLHDGEVHDDDKTRISSEVTDLENAKEFIKDISQSLESATNNYSIEFHIDGEPFYTENPDFTGEERTEEWNPNNKIEITGFPDPTLKKEVVDMLTQEFGGTGATPETEEDLERVTSYFDDEDKGKAQRIFDLLDSRGINTDELDVYVNGSPVVG